MYVNIGDFVLIDFTKFDGTKERGIFYVIYLDSDVAKWSSKFIALKLSALPQLFQVALSPKYYPFLKHESYINCNDPVRFDRNQVIRCIGSSNSQLLTLVQRQLNQFTDSINKQIDKVIDRINYYYSGGVQNGDRTNTD